MLVWTCSDHAGCYSSLWGTRSKPYNGGRGGTDQRCVWYSWSTLGCPFHKLTPLIHTHTNTHSFCSILDPNAECSPYGYPPVSSVISSFPPIWQIASILPSDTNAQTKWAGIQPSVPNIPTKVHTCRWCRHFLLSSISRHLRVLLRAISRVYHTRLRIQIAGGHIISVSHQRHRAFLPISSMFQKCVDVL